MIEYRTLVKAGVHFGHLTSRWVPKMAPYIWGVKNKVHLIDVSKTAHQLERAAEFLEEVSKEGKSVLWVGTKKSARSVVQDVAKKLDMPFVNHRWVGGTLSNFSQVKKSVTRLLHFEDVLEKSEKYPNYTKKELNEIKKQVDRLQNVVGGIRNLAWPIGAVVIVDINKEHSALKEAVSVGVPVVALVDTNADPSLVDYVIPANDDAPRSIQVVLEYLQQAFEKGRAQAKAKKAEAEKPKADKKEAVAEPKQELKADAANEPTTDAKDETKAKKVVAAAKANKEVAKEEKVEKPKAKAKKKEATSLKKATPAPEKKS